MKKRTMLFSTAIVALVFSALEYVAYCAPPLLVRISSIKADAQRYDGKAVELVGVLDSGHLGTFLRDRSSGDIIRLRLVSAENTEGTKVLGDPLYELLRALAAKIELPGEPLEKFEFRIVGRIRVLRMKKGTDDKYYPQIESPIEITPTRVLSISRTGTQE
jgi:hypothetical protein